MNKFEVLTGALAGREEEIFGYQINIDNYERALVKIAEDYNDKPEIMKFGEQLKELLESSKTEQLKSIIIRDVIKEQLCELKESE